MYTVLRYLAVVCLAVALTAVLAGSDELAQGDWLVNGSCSPNAAPPMPGASRPGIAPDKKAPAGPGNAEQRCQITRTESPLAALENL